MINFEEIAECLTTGINLQQVRAGIASVLQHIISQPSDFEAVWHPLGFMYIKLHRADHRTFRLHIWVSDPPEIEREMSQIHNHVWALTSYVLCGVLINHEIALDVEPVLATHRIYQVSYKGNLNMLQPTDSVVSYQIKSTKLVKAGERYTVAPGAFHYTEVPEAVTTATLVVADNVTHSPPIALGPLEAKYHCMNRQKCDLSEIRNAAMAVLGCMKISA